MGKNPKKRRKRRHEWSAPWLYGNVSADVAARELDRVRREAGELTAPTVVDWAEAHPNSRLYEIIFRKDDAEAVRAFREEVARNVILHLRVVTVEGERKRVYVNTRVSEGCAREFLRIETITQEQQAQIAVDKAIRDLRDWVNRYHDLAGNLPGVYPQVRELLATFDRNCAA